MAGRAIVASIAIAFGLGAETPRWPQYRGPDGAGVSDAAAPTEFNPKLNVLWSAGLTQGHSSPSIWGDRLFLTGFDTASKKLEALAYDRRDGKLLWRQTVPADGIEKVHEVSSPATATPVVDGERVYVYFGSAGLFCYDLNGKPVWSRPMLKADVGFGSGTSPVLAGESLILARDDGERHMLALDRKTGQTLWDVKLGGGGPFAGHSTPAIWREQIILHRPGEIIGYAASDGSKRWSVKAASQGTGTPVVHGNLLLVGAWGGGEAELRDPIPDWKTLLAKYDKNGDGVITKDEFPDDLALARRIDAGRTPGAVVTFKRFFDLFIDTNKDGKLSQSEWETVLKMIAAPTPVAHGLLAIRLSGEKDGARADVAWSEERGVPEVPVPLAYRGRVYAVTNGGTVSALDEASGQLVYRARLGAGGLYYASPIAAGDHLYFSSGEGIVTVVRAGDKLEVVARNDLGEPVFATPAAVENRLYVRTAARLYAFGR